MKLKFLLGVALIPLNLNAMNESADEVDYIQINFPETNSDSPVVSTVILDENFDRLSKAVHNAETDTIRKDALEAVHFFIDSAPGTVCSVDLISVIERYCPVHQDTIYFDLYRKIARFPDHASIFHVAKHLWYHGNLADRNIARPLVRKVAQNLTHKNLSWAAQLLRHDRWDEQSDVGKMENEHDIAEDKIIAYQTYRLIAKDIHHEYAWQAAKRLLGGTTEDQAFAREAFRQMVIDQNNKHVIEAAHTLNDWPYYLEEEGVGELGKVVKIDELGRIKAHYLEDVSLITPICRILAQKIEHPHACGAARFLWREYGHSADDTIAESVYSALEYMNIVSGAVDISKQDIKNARRTLRSIAQNTLHKDAYWAAMALKEGNAEDISIARNTFLRMACDVNHKDAYEAACLIYDRDYYLYDLKSRASYAAYSIDQKIANETLKAMAKDKGHPHACSAAKKLCDLDSLKAITSDLAHKDVFDAAKEIWSYRNRNFARPAMMYVASNPKHWRQRDAIACLCNSDVFTDREIGHKLLKNYFPKDKNANIDPI